MKRYVPKHARAKEPEAEAETPAQEPAEATVHSEAVAGSNWERDASADSIHPQPEESSPAAESQPSNANIAEADEEYHEPIPAPPPEPARPKRSRARRVITGVVAITSIILVIVAAVLIITGLPGRSKPRVVEVEIPRGLNAQQIGELLKGKKVVSSAVGFKLYAELNGVSNKLQPGKYVLRENMEYKDLIALLARGPEREKGTEVTIPEGFTIREVAERVGADTGMDPMELAILAGTKAKEFRYDFLQSNPTGSLEGYLFPKTYVIPESADQRWVIDRMLSQFQKETAGLDWASANKRGLTVHEIVTIASLIEREARLPSERPLISAVIANRLRIGKRLEIDATVQYGLPEWKDHLTLDDLKVDTPYNTYLRAGLPPGPIANPGLPAIRAALRPAKVKYLYYVLTDSSGKHTFTNTYSEFLRAKANSKAR